MLEYAKTFVIPEVKELFMEQVKTLSGYTSYKDLLSLGIECVTAATDGSTYNHPNKERIEVVNFGDYQGTMVLVIGAGGYQPHKHWVTYTGYGSCSGCDALQDAWGYGDVPHNTEALYTIVLHMLQRMKEV